MSQVAWASLFTVPEMTVPEMTAALQGLPLTVISNESLVEYKLRTCHATPGLRRAGSCPGQRARR
jgi:hypothetical protein